MEEAAGRLLTIIHKNLKSDGPSQLEPATKFVMNISLKDEICADASAIKCIGNQLSLMFGELKQAL